VVRPLPGVVAAGATRDLVELDGPRPARAAPDPPSTVEGRAAAAGAAEPLAAYQWSMGQIRADRANDVSGGSRHVVVGVLDSGINAGHPDLAPNIDASRSVGCSNDGVPDTSPEAWAPAPGNFTHGTAVAGIIAAARNGVGIAGVAPNVRIASVRLSDDNLEIFPEYLICGYVWAAEHGIQVTNATFTVDPWVRWCDDDPDQAAAAEAMRRAIDYAAHRGVVNVAAIGNSNWDLSHPVLDPYSPLHDPVERLTGNNCGQVPGEMRGVIGVSGVGAQKRKAQYSSYGIRDVDVTAPTGDVHQIPDTPDGNQGILTTLRNEEWGYFFGTSASSPHVAGVVALIRSTHPGWSPWRVIAALTRHADRIPCPPGGVFDPDGTGAWLAHCEGGRSGQGFYGYGLVDALDAVTH